MDPRVDIVVVHYRTPQSTRSLVHRLSTLSGATITVVLNSGDFVSPTGVDVRLVGDGENLGFGRGANLGAAEGHAPWILLLNPDVEISRESVDTLLAHADGDPQVGAAGPRLLYPNGRSQINGGRYSGWMAELSRTASLGVPSRAVRAALRREARSRGLTGPLRRHWITGAAMLLRRAAFSAVGGFDSRFFLYFEDEDLCKRLGERGWGIRVVPDATAMHTVSGTEVPNARRSAIFQRSRREYHSKHSGPILKALVRRDVARRLRVLDEE